MTLLDILNLKLSVISYFKDKRLDEVYFSKCCLQAIYTEFVLCSKGNVFHKPMIHSVVVRRSLLRSK